MVFPLATRDAAVQDSIIPLGVVKYGYPALAVCVQLKLLFVGKQISGCFFL